MNITASTAETAGKIGNATVEVGKVFGNGGTDGLILYSLILAVFLMFLALVSYAILLRRALHSLDTQARQFTAAGEKTAAALMELATSIAAQSSAESAHRVLVATVLGRVEHFLPRSHEKERKDDAQSG